MSEKIVAPSQEAVKRLREYVTSGGTLISEACPGRFSHLGMTSVGSYTPRGILELFGIRRLRRG